MLSLKDKIIFITGASSGIGKACAEQFAKQGAKLILTARRIEKIKNLSDELREQYKTDSLPLQLDVRNKDEVIKLINNLPEAWKAIDVLLNNAGLALASDPIQSGNTENWDIMIDTNLRGLLYVTHAILPNMISRNSGHIINIGSIAGREVYPTGNVYCATKHAVRAISQSLRLDLLGTNIRVTEIDPGAVETEFSEVRWKDKERAKSFYSDFTPLVGNDIADAVIYCTTRPTHVNISEMVIHPTAQASLNHISRQGQKSKNPFD
jgi:3-hydroxy acid dehydrogenase/malonic semialdehyde reductase